MNELINNIKDNTILIIPDNIKEEVLKKIRELDRKLNIKIFNIDEFIKKLTIDFNEETIYQTMLNYNINYSIANLYLNNIKYVEEDSNNYKLHNLFNIKNNIDKYLIKDNLFKKLINKKEIIVYGYDYITKYQYHILKNVENIKVINKEYYNYNHNVYKFNTLEEEVIFVAEEISKLLNNNIDINNIFISNIDSNYYKVIKRIFKMYNIPINIKDTNNVYQTNIGKYFINNLSNNIEELINSIKTKFDMTNKKNSEILKKIISILNKFYFTKECLSVKSNIIEVMKKTNLENTKYKNAINEISIIDNIIDDNKYIFLLSFNLNKFPITIKDEEYINDNIKFDYMEKSYEMNNINKDLYYKVISSIKNLTITYKEKHLNESFYPSVLIDEYKMNVIDKKIEYTNYSNELNKIFLTKYLDELIKYNNKNKNTSLLYSNYEINYNTYDNRYKIINKENLYKYLNNKFNLSYSNMDTYYHCAFKFYISSILKLDEFETNLGNYIGNLYHYVLSKAFVDNFDFDKTVDNYIKNNPYPESFKNKYFITKVLDNLKNVIKTIEYQNTLGNMNESYYEKNIIVEKTGAINTTFKGFIDKILKKDNNVVIIDYKTYSIDIKLNYLPYGLSMQLPVYLYLTKNYDKDIETIGFYIQEILNNSKYNKKVGTTLKEQQKDSLKLKGYTIGNESKISIFDTTYEKSEMIYGMKLSSKGFDRYAKVLTEKQINNIIKLTDNKINECINNIENANFEINPKMILGKNIGCEHCKYKDICFMTNRDIKELEDIKDLEFLEQVE